eukprot:228262_1
MGCCCHTDAERQIAEMVTENKYNKHKDIVPAASDIDVNTPLSLKIGISKMDFSPIIIDGNITPFDDVQHLTLETKATSSDLHIINADESDGKTLDMTTPSEEHKSEKKPNTLNTIVKTQNGWKMEMRFDVTNHEISFIIRNHETDKIWIKQLAYHELDVEEETMRDQYLKIGNIVNNGDVQYTEMDDGNCQIELTNEEDNYEFVAHFS